MGNGRRSMGIPLPIVRCLSVIDLSAFIPCASVLSLVHMFRFIKQLSGVSVQTASGTSIGAVSDVGIDTDTGRVQKVSVRSGGLVKGLMGDELMVDWSQIIEIREDVVVVDDALAKEANKSLARSMAPTAVAMMSEQGEE